VILISIEFLRIDFSRNDFYFFALGVLQYLFVTVAICFDLKRCGFDENRLVERRKSGVDFDLRGDSHHFLEIPLHILLFLLDNLFFFFWNLLFFLIAEILVDRFNLFFDLLDF
jgi:hypothetical protein